jgi:hypothetical protein
MPWQECLEGLTDRSRRPYRQANRLPFQIEALIVQLKREHPSWGAPKFREKLRRCCSDILLPAISTVHAVGNPRQGRALRHQRPAALRARAQLIRVPSCRAAPADRPRGQTEHGENLGNLPSAQHRSCARRHPDPARAAFARIRLHREVRQCH